MDVVDDAAGNSQQQYETLLNGHKCCELHSMG